RDPGDGGPLPHGGCRSPAARTRPAAGPRWQPGQASDRRWCPPRDWLDTRCRRLVRARRWPWQCVFGGPMIHESGSSGERSASAFAFGEVASADGLVACDTPGRARLFRRAQRRRAGMGGSSGDGVPRRTFLRYGVAGATLAASTPVVTLRSVSEHSTPSGDSPHPSEELDELTIDDL